MKTEDIKKMGLAYVQVLEANKKVNKHGHDAVGHEDGDIDNDGDKDKSDSYLHNRRKAISANIKKEEVELDEISKSSVQNYIKAAEKDRNKKTGEFKRGGRVGPYGSEKQKKNYDVLQRRHAGLRIANAKIDNFPPAKEKAHPSNLSPRARVKATESFDLSDLTLEELEDFMMSEDFDQLDEISKKTLGSYRTKAHRDVNKDRSKGVSLSNAKMYPDQYKNSPLKAKVTTTESTVYSRILEKREMHTKGATAVEPIDSKASAGEKDFVAKHGGYDGNESDINGHEAAKHTAAVATTNVKAAPGRHNDQKIGDKSIVKSGK